MIQEQDGKEENLGHEGEGSATEGAGTEGGGEGHVEILPDDEEIVKGDEDDGDEDEAEPAEGEHLTDGEHPAEDA